jgi:predicted RecA/RadA family phage recombinase
MNPMVKSVAAAGSLVAVLLATGGALEASAISAVGGFSECPAQAASEVAQGGPLAWEPQSDVMDNEGSAATTQALLQEYLSYHAEAQEDNAMRGSLMPWPSLRIHAN